MEMGWGSRPRAHAAGLVVHRLRHTCGQLVRLLLCGRLGVHADRVLGAGGPAERPEVEGAWVVWSRRTSIQQHLLACLLWEGGFAHAQRSDGGSMHVCDGYLCKDMRRTCTAAVVELGGVSILPKDVALCPKE